MDSLPQQERPERADDALKRSSGKPGTISVLTAVVVLAACGVGVYFAARHRPGGPSARQIYDLNKYKVTDPRLVLYREVEQFATGFREATCLALGPGGELYVGGVLPSGGKAVRIWDADVWPLKGTPSREVELSGTPFCLAVAEDGTLYVGMGAEVMVLDPHDSEGAFRRKWSYGPQAIVTGIALTEAHAFVADAGARVVHVQPLPDGAPGKLAAAEKDAGVVIDDGLVIYSPCLDVAAGEDGLVRVVDPGRHRVKLYAPEGVFLSAWKSNPSISIGGFSGCCNPARIALLPDGSVVTSEKGLPRVKLYSSDGEFMGVVAGPESFEAGTKAPDIAVDGTGRVVVLDRASATVRVFARTTTPERGPAAGG